MFLFLYLLNRMLHTDGSAPTRFNVKQNDQDNQSSTLNPCLLQFGVQNGRGRCGRVLQGGLHPVHKHGHLGVHAVIPRVRAAPPPGDHARQEVGAAVLRDQRAAVVAAAAVLGPVLVPGAQHVVGDVEPGLLGALGALDDGDAHLAEDWGQRAARGGAGVAPGGPLAPSGDGVVADRQQLPLGELLGWEADGDGVWI